MYVMTPSDHMSHDVSYFSGPNTSGAEQVHTHTTHFTDIELFKLAGRRASPGTEVQHHGEYLAVRHSGQCDNDNQ